MVSRLLQLEGRRLSGFGIVRMILMMIKINNYDFLIN